MPTEPSMVVETCVCGAKWEGSRFYANERVEWREAHRSCREAFALRAVDSRCRFEVESVERCGGGGTIPTDDPMLTQAGCAVEPCPGCPDCQPSPQAGSDV